MSIAATTATTNHVGSATPGCRPWEAHGLSERTFYRRKAAGLIEASPPPEQHAAHAQAWFATLDVWARLDYRALVRRWIRDARKAAMPARSGDELLKVYVVLRGLH